MFHERHAAEIQAISRSARRPEAQEDAQPALFASSVDRLFLVALFLHCADLSNAVKPMSIVDKCDPALDAPRLI